MAPIVSYHLYFNPVIPPAPQTARQTMLPQVVSPSLTQNAVLGRAQTFYASIATPQCFQVIFPAINRRMTPRGQAPFYQLKFRDNYNSSSMCWLRPLSMSSTRLALEFSGQHQLQNHIQNTHRDTMARFMPFGPSAFMWRGWSKILISRLLLR